MKKKSMYKAPVIALAALMIAACGGGGEEAPSSTGSNSQTRLDFETSDAIDFVKAANGDSTNLVIYTRYFGFLAPAAPGAQQKVAKDVGIAPCTWIVRDPDCTGTLRVETEFPVNVGQQTFRENSKMTFEWQDIKSATLLDDAAYNIVETFTFQTSFASTPPFTGTFSTDFKRTTPTPYESSIQYEASDLAVTVNSGTGEGLISGKVTKNASPLRFDSDDESLTFTNWSNFRKNRQAGASVRMASRKYLSSSLPSTGVNGVVNITVISSDLGRTEYQVVASAGSSSSDVSRTVIVTIDAQGKPVYTAT